MSAIEQILSRRSTRKYSDEPIRAEVLEKILEAGRLAPTATNQQPWHFVVVRTDCGKQACTFGSFNRFAAEASLVVLGLYRRSEATIEKYSLMDVTIALQNMVVAGWVQGVGSCWMGAFDEGRLRRALSLPSDAVIVGGIAFGMPEAVPAQPRKKPLSDIVHFDEW